MKMMKFYTGQGRKKRCKTDHTIASIDEWLKIKKGKPHDLNLKD